MRKLLRLTSIVFLASAGEVRADECRSCDLDNPGCPRIVITDDNHLDHLCGPERIGQTLADTDDDGIPDLCKDKCPCVKNAHDPVTGFAPCPEPTKPRTSEPLRCVDGELVGIDTSRWLAFIRPRMFVYFSERDWSRPVTSAGAHVWIVHNLDDFACEAEMVGDKASITLTHEPEWFWRTGLYFDPALIDDVTFVMAETGIDFAPNAHYLSFGLQTHILGSFEKEAPNGAHLGVAVRVGVLDAFALLPFVQFDLADDAAISIGGTLSLDLKIIEELGVSAERLKSGAGL